MAQILDHRGEPIKTAALTKIFAEPQGNGSRQVWHASAADNLTPARLADLLQQARRGQGTGYLTLAEEMEERDPHYASVLGTRRLACAGLPVRVDALSDDKRDIEIADAVRALVDDPDFDYLRMDLLDALGKGYSVCEIEWHRDGKRWTPERYPHRDARFFQFDKVTGRDLRLRDESNQDGLTLPAYKFIVHTPRLRPGMPLRSGLAFLCAVGYMCKAWAWRDWMAFADVYGIPMRVGKYGPGATKEQINLLIAAVSNLASDAGAVIPDSMRIEFEKAANTAGAGDFFEKLANWWDKQISKAVLGQTMTADDGASLSQAKVHDDVRKDLLQADAKALSSTLNRDLIRPFVDLNFGPGRYPNLVIAVEEPEDTAALVDAVVKLVPLGLQVEQSVLRDKLGLPDPDPGAELLQAPSSPMLPAFNRAENREVPAPPRNVEIDREDQLAAMLAREADPLVGQWVEQIEALVNRANSFEDIQDGLLDVLPDMDADKFARVVQHALAVAGVAGMSDARDDSHV